MVEIIKQEQWRKSEAFLLPLTGLMRNKDLKIESYLFWEEHSIEDYHLTVKIEYNDRKGYDNYLKKCVLDSSGNCLLEVYEHDGFEVLIFDLSEWYMDIDMFLKGRYSQLSTEAKQIIQSYHTFYEKGKPMINVTIYSCLFPNDTDNLFEGMTAMEYIAHYYGFDIAVLKELGEVCNKYDRNHETLTLDRHIDSQPIVEQF